MARQIRWVLAALLACGPMVVAADALRPVEGTAPQAEKSGAHPDNRRDAQERRPWWKNPSDMAEIGLTADQSRQIDEIFHAAIEKMRPMGRQVKELERGVDATMRANTADIEAFARQVEQVEHKRAELNKARTVMLYRMRRVLRADQNLKMQALFDRREAERRNSDRRR